VAIRHTAIADQASLLVDDITIVEGGDPVTPINPTNAELVTANVYVRMKAGLGQGVYESETLSVSAGSLSSNVTLSGEVTQGASITQTISLVAGWNWWSAQVVADDLLAQIEQGLGANGVKIVAKDGSYRTYSTNLGGWFGTLTGITVGQMYKIQANTSCDISLTGTPVNPSECPIILKPGFTWIGYTPSVSLSVSEAMSGYTPTAGDVIKSKSGSYASYSGNLGRWIGDLTLEPGKGYIYESKATETKTFYYPSGN
jgi:hypothetical protein